jgi:predicted nucleic acid-binding protein
VIAYFDSSALVKLVVDEPGSGDAAALWDGADAVVSSRVANVEVLAALAAARRATRLGEVGHHASKQEWAGLPRRLERRPSRLP